MNARLLKAIIILPGTVTVFIPALLLWIDSGFSFEREVREALVTISTGIIFICIGLMMAAHTSRLFLHVGKGTPAPWDPPQKLVIRGAYRHVRNPMISGVLSILLGESLVFGSLYLLAWFGVFFIMNNVYFSLFEEPGLRKRFGREYEIYASNVPRWIPRIRPYEPDNNKQ
jgi:protein-S-isoprenylcysteine O-methyltransferase Ste14